MTTTEPKRPEVGDRVRVVKDLVTGDGRVYLREGSSGIVEAIDPNPIEGDPPIEVYFENGEDWVEFDDIEVITPAAEVEQEPLKFAITATIKVEVEITVEGDNHRDAIEHFEAHALDYLSDNETMKLKKTKVIDIMTEDRH